MLWWWALDYAKDGSIAQMSDAEMAAACEWSGDANEFMSAIRKCNFVEPDGMLHDWHEYAGRLLEERRRDRERKREFRRMSNRRPPEIGRTAVVPNPTQPNPTQPKTLSGSCDPVKVTPKPENPPRVKFEPPTLAMVQLHFAKIGLPMEQAELFIAHHAQRNWIPKGSTRQMVNWHHAATTWKHNWENGSFRPTGPNRSENSNQPSLLMQDIRDL